MGCELGRESSLVLLLSGEAVAMPPAEKPAITAVRSLPGLPAASCVLMMLSADDRRWLLRPRP